MPKAELRRRVCAETLEMIREEILRMSVDQMPVEMQVLDELVAMMGEPK